MKSPITRILLHILFGVLVSHGLLSTDFGKELMTNSDVVAVSEVFVGFVISGIAWGWYWAAKKFGWTT